MNAQLIFEIFFFHEIERYFPDNTYFNQVINYALSTPGKRIRPLLCLGVSEIINSRVEIAKRCAVALEIMHIASLIHDDLPAMDDDNFRRGRLTTHKVYGDDLAILAGDALLNFAPEYLIKSLNDINVDPLITNKIINVLLECSGHNGMMLGQVMDMKSNELSKGLDKIEYLKNIHINKTGKLFRASFEMIAISNPSLSMSSLNKFIESGEKLGLFFQILDDLSDIMESTKQLGKTAGKDLEQNKMTYPSLLGIEEAINYATDLISFVDESVSQLSKDNYSEKQDFILNEVICSLLKRLTKYRNEQNNNITLKNVI